MYLQGSTKNCQFFSFDIKNPVWSCCYDLLDMNLIYAGCSNGNVYGYDLRKISDPVYKYSETNALPIHSLMFDSRTSNLLIGSLNGISSISCPTTEKYSSLRVPENICSGKRKII